VDVISVDLFSYILYSRQRGVARSITADRTDEADGDDDDGRVSPVRTVRKSCDAI